MKINKISWLLPGIVTFMMLACNKDRDNILYKEEVLQINLAGYNATEEELRVKVDTFNLPLGLTKGSFKHRESFIFKGDQQTVRLSITEKSTGKSVVEKEYKRGEDVADLSFLYMNGEVRDMPQKPAVEKGKISLTYMFIPEFTHYSEPVDLVIGKYFATPKVFEEITRIRNVKPNEFSESATFSTFTTGRQEYNGVITTVSFQVRIYKPGTNIPYVDGTDYTWNNISSSAPKPPASTAASKLYIFSESPNGNIMSFFTRLDY
ncbi:hypothetical protein [Chitinophaga nivalis]|uniref:DUF3823 domain-containing protein n=1 Tax=Chitinophaga nivalis TaxID=2991709 RepID=A0ABT3IEU9_9BACT|nr:hypothetical protein [Chitinophaga nivalis]MCW3467828.1 hypothetical protein [Chitinophaga nivalis]MCW3482480.1 hypothetical protein [Chitinophaga nivalis]